MIKFNNVLRNKISAQKKLKIIYDLMDNYEIIKDEKTLIDAENICNHILKNYPCFKAAKALSLIILKSQKLDKLENCLNLMKETMDEQSSEDIMYFEKFKKITMLDRKVLSNILNII